MEVRNIIKKIGDFNEKLDVINILFEFRENLFMKYEFRYNNSIKEISKVLNEFGWINISIIFFVLCLVKVGEVIFYFKFFMVIYIVDYYGNFRIIGFDFVCIEVRIEKGELVEFKVRDSDDGSYEV